MSRVFIASMVALGAAVAANAGSIQIGGAAGLSNNYISQGSGAVCAAGAGNCVQGSTTGWTERNYDVIMFQSVSNSQSAPTTPVPFSGYAQNSATPAGMSATDSANQVTYSMISDGVTGIGASINFWESVVAGGGQASIVVPIGVFGVQDVWTMLDNQWGSLGGKDTSVTFNFGNASNATTGLTTIKVDLTNTNNQGNVSQLRASVSCLSVQTALCNDNTNPHGTLSQGTVINGVTVNTGVVYTSSYDTVTGGGFYNGTAGTVWLDDQQFVFGPSLTNLWLVSMTVTENLGNTYNSSPNHASETALSAITVDTVPEPGTIFLLVSAFGALGLMRFKRA